MYLCDTPPCQVVHPWCTAPPTCPSSPSPAPRPQNWSRRSWRSLAKCSQLLTELSYRSVATLNPEHQTSTNTAQTSLSANPIYLPPDITNQAVFLESRGDKEATVTSLLQMGWSMDWKHNTFWGYWKTELGLEGILLGPQNKTLGHCNKSLRKHL